MLNKDANNEEAIFRQLDMNKADELRHLINMSDGISQ